MWCHHQEGFKKKKSDTCDILIYLLFILILCWKQQMKMVQYGSFKVLFLLINKHCPCQKKTTIFFIISISIPIQYYNLN